METIRCCKPYLGCKPSGPLPRPEDVMTSLSGEKCFTKLDLTAAYQQMPLNEESRRYIVTVNTYRGLYQYKHLPFGVASALAGFHPAMDAILQGFTYVICYLDDILITGPTDQEHLETLEEVLSRLKQHGIRLKNKCQFLQDAVEYLGHQIDAQGIHQILYWNVKLLREISTKPRDTASSTMSCSSSTAKGSGLVSVKLHS